MVNWWFGLVVWIIPSYKGLLLGGRLPNHRAPTTQVTISWASSDLWKYSQLLCQILVEEEVEARFVDGPLGQATVKPVCFPGGLGGHASSMELV